MYVKKSVKGGGGSVMVWGMFSAAGFGPLIQLHGRMNANVHQKLLQQHADLRWALLNSNNQPLKVPNSNHIAKYHSHLTICIFVELSLISLIMDFCPWVL